MLCVSLRCPGGARPAVSQMRYMDRHFHMRPRVVRRPKVRQRSQFLEDQSQYANAIPSAGLINPRTHSGPNTNLVVLG